MSRADDKSRKKMKMLSRSVIFFSCVLACVFSWSTMVHCHERESAEKKSSPAGKRGQTATLTWLAPTTDTDGKPLKDLAGYTVYYGANPHRYTRKIKVPLDSPDLVCRKIDTREGPKPAPLECTCIIRNLDSSARYFAVKAYTQSGKESDLSNEAKK